MQLFWRLLAGHLLADFTLQTDKINAWKRRSTLGLLAHAGIHPLVNGLLVAPYLNRVWARVGEVDLNGWACVLILFLLHFVEDKWRVHSIHKRGSADSTLFFLWDQLFHVASIAILFPVLSTGPGSWVPERWPILLCLGVAVTHFCTVLIYFIEKDLWGASFPGFDEKYVTMAERLVLALLIMLPGPAGLPLAAAWIAAMGGLRRVRVLDYSFFGLWLGVAFSIPAGLAAKALLYA